VSPCPSCGALLHLQIELGTGAVSGGNINNHPLRNTWRGMIRRCYDPRKHNYHRYGGRGIKVCQRWLGDFWAFAEDVGPRPKGHTLDRKDNDGDYEPDNVRWATPGEQRRNTGEGLAVITLSGRTQTWAEWISETGWSKSTLIRRMREGWPDDQVISGLGPKPISFAAVARQHGVQPATLKARIKRGLTMEQAISHIPWQRTGGQQ